MKRKSRLTATELVSLEVISSKCFSSSWEEFPRQRLPQVMEVGNLNPKIMIRNFGLFPVVLLKLYRMALLRNLQA